MLINKQIAVLVLTQSPLSMSLTFFYIFLFPFHRLITCTSISSKIKSNMLLTFQDRFRIPWRGGAKQVRSSPYFEISVSIINWRFLLADIFWSNDSDDSLTIVPRCGCSKHVQLYRDMFSHSIVFGLLLLLSAKDISKVIK